MLAGETVLLGNETHHTSYEIERVTDGPGGTVLHFGDTPTIVGVGKVSGLDAAARRVTTSTTFDSWRVDGGRHSGRRLVSSDKRVGFHIDSFDLKTFALQGDAAAIARAFSPAGEPPGFWIGDVGVGDSWEIPALCQVERSPGGWKVRCNVRVEVGLPLAAGRKLSLKSDASIAEVAVDSRDGLVWVSLTPEMATEGVILLREE